MWTEMVRSAITFISQVILHMLRTCNIKLERILDCQLTEENKVFQTYLKGSRDPRISNYCRKLLNSELPSEVHEESSTQSIAAERSNVFGADADADEEEVEEEEEEDEGEYEEDEVSEEEGKGIFMPEF